MKVGVIQLGAGQKRIIEIGPLKLGSKRSDFEHVG
jgi:hypothetical protein